MIHQAPHVSSAHLGTLQISRVTQSRTSRFLTSSRGALGNKFRHPLPHPPGVNSSPSRALHSSTYVPASPSSSRRRIDIFFSLLRHTPARELRAFDQPDSGTYTHCYTAPSRLTPHIKAIFFLLSGLLEPCTAPPLRAASAITRAKQKIRRTRDRKGGGGGKRCRWLAYLRGIGTPCQGDDGCFFFLFVARDTRMKRNDYRVCITLGAGCIFERRRGRGGGRVDIVICR